MGSQKNTDFSKRTRKTKPEYYQGLAVGYKLNIRSKKIVEPIASKETSESIPESNRSDSNYSVKIFSRY
jgi:hypothetical protein